MLSTTVVPYRKALRNRYRANPDAYFEQNDKEGDDRNEKIGFQIVSNMLLFEEVMRPLVTTYLSSELDLEHQ
jgi:hypothetical protein